MKKILLLLSIFTVSVSYFFAQKSPIKFGKPSMEEMTKNVYEIDSTAPAIILCNYGYFNSLDLKFTHLMRIKILKKEGYSWANQTFNTGSRANIRARIFNLIDGKIVSEKLSGKSIFREKVINNYYITKISMPNVKVGSVIDIEVTSPWIPMSWYFQKSIPMLHSELIMEDTEYFTFSRNYYGYVAFKVIKPNRWVAVNIPAFQEEPYMLSINNYLAHFEYELSSIHFPGERVYNIAGSWDRVNQSLDRSLLFGGALRKNTSFFSDMAKNIKAKYTEKTDLIKAAVDTIKTMNWDGEDRLIVTSDAGLKYYFNKGTGNSAEINLSLIRLLQALNFKVYPVILKTRDKGLISQNNAELSKINYVLAYVKINNNFLLIDGTDNLAPYYLLPEKCLNGEGRISSLDTSDWVKLSNNYKYRKKTFYLLNFDPENMSLKGTVNTTYKDYAAYNFRKDYANDGNMENYLLRLSKKFNGTKINNDTLINLNDIYKPVIENADIEIQNQCFQADSLIYINVLPDRLTVNPFKQKERKYPIAFLYPKEYKTTVIINIPENYKAYSIPKSVHMKLPDNGSSFTLMINVQKNRITLSYKLSINKTFYLQKEYQDLKTFYQYIIDKTSEPVILKTS